MGVCREKVELSDEQLHVVLHTLGVQNVAGRWKAGGWRNHFVTYQDTDDWPVCCSLVASGWMSRRKLDDSVWGESFIFYVTEMGRDKLRAAGWKIKEERK